MKLDMQQRNGMFAGFRGNEIQPATTGMVEAGAHMADLTYKSITGGVKAIAEGLKDYQKNMATQEEAIAEIKFGIEDLNRLARLDPSGAWETDKAIELANKSLASGKNLVGTAAAIRSSRDLAYKTAGLNLQREERLASAALRERQNSDKLYGEAAGAEARLDMEIQTLQNSGSQGVGPALGRLITARDGLRAARGSNDSSKLGAAVEIAGQTLQALPNSIAAGTAQYTQGQTEKAKGVIGQLPAKRVVGESPAEAQGGNMFSTTESIFDTTSRYVGALRKQEQEELATLTPEQRANYTPLSDAEIADQYLGRIEEEVSNDQSIPNERRQAILGQVQDARSNFWTMADRSYTDPGENPAITPLPNDIQYDTQEKIDQAITRKYGFNSIESMQDAASTIAGPFTVASGRQDIEIAKEGLRERSKLMSDLAGQTSARARAASQATSFSVDPKVQVGTMLQEAEYNLAERRLMATKALEKNGIDSKLIPTLVDSLVGRVAVQDSGIPGKAWVIPPDGSTAKLVDMNDADSVSASAVAAETTFGIRGMDGSVSPENFGTTQIPEIDKKTGIVKGHRQPTWVGADGKSYTGAVVVMPGRYPGDKEAAKKFRASASSTANYLNAVQRFRYLLSQETGTQAWGTNALEMLALRNTMIADSRIGVGGQNTSDRDMQLIMAPIPDPSGMDAKQFADYLANNNESIFTALANYEARRREQFLNESRGMNIIFRPNWPEHGEPDPVAKSAKDKQEAQDGR